MQTQVERATIGGVRATENYGFQPGCTKHPGNLWRKHCKPFTSSWQVCSEQQHTKITSIFSCSCKFTAYSATPHSEFANESSANLLFVSESLTRTRLPRPGCCSLSSMSCCCGSLAAQCRNAWNVSVSRYFRDPSLGNVCTSHRTNPPAHCPSETVTVGSLFSPPSPTRIKIFSPAPVLTPAPLCEAKSSWEMKIPQISNIPVSFQTCCGSGYDLERQTAFRGLSPP